MVTQDFGRFGVKRHVERSPEQIDATACERWRVIWISPEFRRAVIRCPPPPVREGSVAALGAERPDVEVLDAIRSVQSELDLMVRLAGLRLRERYQDWDRGPFTGESQDHISVYEVTAAPAG
jgi:hypothetical protein